MPMSPMHWFATVFGSLLLFVVGLLILLVVFDNTDAAGTNPLPRTATVELAPNGMAYCPTDSSTPHPTPCMFRQP